MAISDVFISSISAGDLKITDMKIDIFDLDLSIGFDLKKYDNDKAVMEVLVAITYSYKNKSGTMASNHRFILKKDGVELNSFKEEDYIPLANIIQCAINQSVLIFMQKSTQLQFQIIGFQLQSLDDTYNNIKTGVYSRSN